MANRCPGQDPRNWTFEDIFNVQCPDCAAPVEFFRDDVVRACHACGAEVRNPRFNNGCAGWCASAKWCAAGKGFASPTAESKKGGKSNEA